MIPLMEHIVIDNITVYDVFYEKLVLKRKEEVKQPMVHKNTVGAFE
jgi:hypothetical protein